MGKTSLLRTYRDRQFTLHKPSIGLDCVSTKLIAPSGEDIVVQIWDTAGQERFRTITHTFYKHGDGIIVAFDVTDAATFQSVRKWLESIYQHAAPDIVKVLVGNKIDLEEQREVSIEEAKQLADVHKMVYFETSAKLNKNVDELIGHMMEQVYQKKFAGDEGRDTNTVTLQPSVIEPRPKPICFC